MKLYFAKYLAVGGKIESAKDYGRDSRGILMTHFAYNAIGGSGSFTKAKPFLCSKDVQVGDAVRVADGRGSISLYEWKVEEAIKDEYQQDRFRLSSGDMECIEAPYDLYKVVGEVLTPGIKEGQQFTEEEISFLTLKI